MIVNIGIDDSLHVLLDTEDKGYPGPDVLDDLCARARTLFRECFADAQAAQEQ